MQYKITADQREVANRLLNKEKLDLDLIQPYMELKTQGLIYDQNHKTVVSNELKKQIP